MASMTYYAFDVAMVTLGIAFILFCVHTTLLAAGRRQTATAATTAGTTTTTTVTVPESGTTSTSAGNMAQVFTWTSFILVGIGLLIRAYLVGRGPWGNLYEFATAFSFGVVGGYLALERRFPIRALGALPLGVALGLFLYSATLPKEIEPLVPALQNPPLLTIHVGLAMISYGIFAMSFAAGLAYLVQEKRTADGRTVDRYAWLPTREVLDAVAWRAVIVGFPLFATMIVLGSWWASVAWSRYWGWDPKETSALVTWLVYAVYLHLRNQKGWRCRPAALVLVVGFGMVLFTLFGNLWFAGLHSYSGLS